MMHGPLDAARADRPAAAGTCGGASGPTAGTDGVIPIATPPGLLAFHFGYGEIPVSGTIRPEGEAYLVLVRAEVGLVPYSLENREARARLLTVIGWIGRVGHGTVTLGARQTLVVSGERLIAPPLNAVAMVAGLTTLMIELHPLFEAVGDILPDLKGALPILTRR